MKNKTNFNKIDRQKEILRAPVGAKMISNEEQVQLLKKNTEVKMRQLLILL